MQIFDITVPAYQPFVVHAPGRYIKYVAGSNGGGDATLLVTPGGMGGQKITLTPGQAYRLGSSSATPDSWTLANYANSNTIVGKVVIGDGQIDDPTIAGVVQVVDGGKSRTLAGVAYAASCYSNGVAAAYSRMQLWNPANSGKRAVVEAVNVFASTASNLFMMSSAAPLATLVLYGQPKLLGGSASVMQLMSDTNAAGPSSSLQSLAVVGGQSQTFVPHEPVIVPPGFGLLVWDNVVNNSISGNFEWYEEANV